MRNPTLLRILLCAALGSMLLSFGCGQHIPKDALLLKQESLKDREMQTRRFETGNEQAMLTASAGLLQDLGFTIDEAETDLGVIAASKTRDAVSGGQIAAAVVLAALTGVATPVDERQIIRASVVSHPLGKPDEAKQKDIDALCERTSGQVVDLMAREIGQSIPDKARAAVLNEVRNDFSSLLGRKLCVFMSSGQVAVRVTFQRVIFNTQGQVTLLEQINDVKVYQEFFDKLAQSVFLEAHEI